MVPHLPKSPEKKVGFEAFKEACKKVVSSLETIAGILLTGIGVVASTDASVSTSFAEIYVSLSIFKLWRRPRYQIVAGIKRYNYGALLQCAACNNSLFYGTEHRASNWAGLFYGKTKKKTSTKPPTTTKKTHKKYSSRPFGGQGESSEPR